MLDNKLYDTGEEEQSYTMNHLNIFVFQGSFILVLTLTQAELHTEHLNKQMARKIKSKTRTEREVWAKSKAEKQKMCSTNGLNDSQRHVKQRSQKHNFCSSISAALQ